jgi:hypothetical protein
MREQILDLHVSLPPAAVAERLLEAAANTPRVHGEHFEVTVSGEEVRISATPGDYERPRAVCTGSLVADGSGSRLRLRDADLAPGARILLLVIGGVGTTIAALVAVEGWRQGKTAVLWGALGFVAFLLMVGVLVAFATTGSAGDDARAFVRDALDDSHESHGQAAG